MYKIGVSKNKHVGYTHVPLIRGNTGLHGCHEHALGVSSVALKEFNDFRTVGKSHPTSVLRQDGTTTPGPYPKRFDPGNGLLAPGTSRNMFCI